MKHRPAGRKKIERTLAPIEPQPKITSASHPIFFRVAACIAVVSVLLGATAVWLQAVESKAGVKIRAPRDTRVRRAIDGVMVSPASSTPRLVAVVLDNLRDAYPLAGLREAALIYEVPVEGSGTTRLLVFFTDDSKAAEIGPVRSLRPYFTDFALELGAMPVHVGGSPEALAEVQSEDMPTLNQFFQGEYFWRSGERPRPHNVMTSSDLLAQGLRDRWNGSKKITPWTYRDGKKSVRGSKVRNISPDDRDSAFTWKNGAYVWERSTSWEQPVRAQNVIVIETNIKTIDGMLRRSVTTTGSGKATVFTSGRKVSGAWTKKNPEDRINFTADDKPIPLAPGLTWIHVVPKGTVVKSSP